MKLEDAIVWRLTPCKRLLRTLVSATKMSSSKFPWQRLLYPAALAGVAVALAARAALGPVLGGDGLLLLTLAVMLSANLGGLGPGLCATALGLLSLTPFFANLIGNGSPEPARLGLFVVIGVFVSWLSEQSRRAEAGRNAAVAERQREAEEALRRGHEELERRVEERTAALAHVNAKLEEEARERRQVEAERARLLESERQARTEAERAGRIKDEFLATLSHELRTPLNSILGWTQLLRRKEQSFGELVQGLEAIERSGRMQAQLIEDLLDMSRIVSGKLRLELRPVEPVGVVAEAVETARPAAQAKGIALETAFDPREKNIHADSQRLQQVLGNLLTNAIKFTPRGGRIEVRVAHVGPAVEISVCDTGQGIAPEFLPHVFDRFRQADSSTTRTHGGLGLGLAIAKHLVVLQGGAIYASSAGSGQGATFTIALPATPIRTESAPHLPVLLSAPVGREPPLLTDVRILVVDDDSDACTIVRRLFEEREATVLTASSVLEAFELFQRERPDVLVSDIGMPGQDGYELIRLVRGLGARRGGATPAVALTAFARAEDRVRTLRAGYQMHVAKPVEPLELIMVVANLIARRPERTAGLQKEGAS